MHIDSYEFGRIVIDGREFIHDLIIFPDHIEPNWWRREGHLVTLGDIEGVLIHKPARLIIGTGHSGLVRVDPEVNKACAREKIKLTIQPTSKAVLTYNKEPKDAVAALHLTC